MNNKYESDSIIYTYSIIFDKINNRHDSLEYHKYNFNKDEIESLEINLSNNILEKTIYYEFNYHNIETDINSKLLYSDYAFKKPIEYFLNIYLVPKMVISNQIELDEGFTITEDIPYGYTYLSKNKYAISAKKYGLSSIGNKAGIIDYNKFISKYSVINGMLIVYNRFMEDYNYIASKKEYGSYIMTQDNLFNRNKSLIDSNIDCIFFDDCPRNILISKNKDINSIINIEYNDIGIPKSVFINNQEKCEYKEEYNTTLSLHPLIYEPFCLDLYNDIILDNIPYYVYEEYENTDEYILYKRTVFKK